MKEIKVKIYAHENDDYNELWKVISGDTKQKYFARHTFGKAEWYFVADPLGYCELDHACPDDYIFIVCDDNGKELLRDSNGGISNTFPTLEQKTKNVWNSIKEKYATIDGLNDWLLTFLTKNIIETKLSDVFCHYENWTWGWQDTVNKEVIERFNHLGVDYCVYKLTKKHRYCDCEWVDYYAGHAKMDEEYPSYVEYFGSWYDGNIMGDCYSPNDATKTVKGALEQIYKSDRGLSTVSTTPYGVSREKLLSFNGAAAYLSI